MLQLDGIDYTVNTPEENARQLVEYVNQYCQDRGIKNSKGEVVNIAINTANPLYMIVFGLSYLTTILQKLVYSAACALNVSESSERQLLNLADDAGVKRNAATKTTIQGTVYAVEPDVGASDCVISRDLSATVRTGTYNIVFHPAWDVTIPVNEARQIMLIAEVYGAYNISENTITEFDAPLPGFRRMVTKASVPGQDQESIASLRERIQRRSVEGTQVDRAAEAIRELDGVSLCNIYFNYDSIGERAIGSRQLVVPARKALLMVQGYSDDIASTFYRYLLCETTGAEYPEDVGVITQKYVTKSQQELSVYIVPPAQVPVYVRLFVNDSITYLEINGLKDAIASLSANLTVGQPITTKMVLDIAVATYKDLKFQGADVSKDGTSYSYTCAPSEDAVFIFNMDNIQVISTLK